VTASGAAAGNDRSPFAGTAGGRDDDAERRDTPFDTAAGLGLGDLVDGFFNVSGCLRLANSLRCHNPPVKSTPRKRQAIHSRAGFWAHTRCRDRLRSRP